MRFFLVNKNKIVATEIFPNYALHREAIHDWAERVMIREEIEEVSIEDKNKTYATLAQGYRAKETR